MKQFFEFLNKSVTEYQACSNICHILKDNGFEYLDPASKWNLKKGGNYFTTKDQSSVIAFKIGQKLNSKSFNIVSSHLDSPNLKIKPNGIITKPNYTSLNTEVYGGPILSTWLDRPLSIAGRVFVRTENGIKAELVNIDEDLLVIPNVCIHLKKDNDINPQRDLLPLAGLTKYESVNEILENKLGINKDNIMSYDLSVYNRDQAKLVGVDKELFVSPRIDNLECAYSSLQAFLNSNNESKINVYASFNNEEVGSTTKQGAASTFLKEVLSRIVGNNEDYYQALANSFLVSADNAHAVHPNRPDLADPTNQVFMNKGVVIKHNANQRYTTDALSNAYFKLVCDNVNAKYQHYTNRSDQRGGSTLGSISSTQVSIPSVDIGLAQLAMHSCLETAGVEDFNEMIKALTSFYNANFKVENDQIKM